LPDRSAWKRQIGGNRVRAPCARFP